jgi:hypothetical protein
MLMLIMMNEWSLFCTKVCHDKFSTSKNSLSNEVLVIFGTEKEKGLLAIDARRDKSKRLKTVGPLYQE